MQLQDAVEEILRSHGLNTSRHKEWVLVNGKLPGIMASIFNEQTINDSYSLQLDIAVTFGNELTVIESFAGVGLSKQAAISDAFANFFANSLHVFLAAFWGHVDNQQVTVEEWEINGSKWKASIGPYGTRVFNNAPVVIPENLFPTIEMLIRSLQLEGDLYWMHTYYCDTDAVGEPISEVLLNNNIWESAQDVIKSLSWPQGNRYYSVRNFLILQRENNPGN